MRYSKLDRSKYISHLDLTATLQRAFLRASVKLKYSEGFNPHPYISVALPLSVGYESICELVDVAILGDALPNIEEIKLPEGIDIESVYIPTRKFNDIKWLEISGKLYYDREVDNDFISRIKTAFTRDSIIITKRTKRGEKDIDIVPHIRDVNIEYKDNILLSAKISAQDPTLNPVDLMNALDDDLKPSHTDIRRVEIYDANMIKFE